MADNNVNVIQDQDFYGAVRFFGSVTFKSTGSFVFDASITVTGLTVNGNMIANGNISGQTITAQVNLAGILRTTVVSDTTSDPPTEADLESALGEPVSGAVRFLVDTANSKNYIVVSFNGTVWSYAVLTEAL